ncbi:TOMM precursor leader peptide-binding protein [Caulobacter sp. S45]|uniref:TOMM precursor leader peptide-binding protein n=1 Tax=Caulobacter sp. S45 TaxID=1641861 RepID=UPI0015758B38|nr:TOMM precursor leader peptide-binding protein [Caulobacter sp. S45]
MAFSDQEVERYARHLVLREIGGAGQQALHAARVLMVGMGGLGSAAAPMLAAAGVGTLGLVDGDTVGLSNLQRQTLYATGDVGRLKVEAAAERLGGLNPGVSLDLHPVMLGAETAPALTGGYDVVLDGTDDFATRFAVNAACVEVGRPLVSGAIERWTGQVGVFAAGLTRGRPLAERQPCYRCLTPDDIPPGAETCARVGVVGALAGVIGAMMALEAVKWIAGAGQPLAGRLLIYDALAGETRTVRLSPDPACPVCGGATTLM